MQVRSCSAARLALAWCAVALCACQGPPPTGTALPTPTFTPSFVETGDGALARQLIEVCASTVETTTQTIPHGPVLVVWTGSGRVDPAIQGLLRDAAQPRSEADVAFVACLERSEKDFGFYSPGGGRAYRVDYHVKLVLYPDAAIVEQDTVLGGAPPKRKLGGGSGHGGLPEAKTACWVAERTGTGIRSALGLHRGGVRAVQWSPDGAVVASGGDTTVRLWDVDSGQRITTLANHSEVLYDVAWSPDGKTLASGGYDHTVRLWDVASQGERASLTHPDTVTALAWSPDGKTLAVASGDQVTLWEVATGEPVTVWTGHTDDVVDVAFRPDGTMLASGSRDMTVRLWDIQSGQCVAVLSGHESWVMDVAWSPDGTELASASKDGTVRLWDVEKAQEMAVLPGPEEEEPLSVAWSPDGKKLASGSNFRRIRLWQVKSVLSGGRQEDAILTGHQGWVNSLAFSPNGGLLASGGDDRTVRLWDIGSGELVEWY
jgi:DNA-binding beta-propeller fold protein YncE